MLSTRFLGRKLLVSDSKWYLPVLEEIWQEQIYKFETDNNSPLIIDCGANIGLSVLYWKHLFPHARVIAFEPDKSIYKLLQTNVETFGLTNVDLRPLAVWKSSGILSFAPDNSLGGKLVHGEGVESSVTVETVRLRNLLNQPVDMLKIDIEGAEYEVLQDCADALGNVDKLFVEYHGNASDKQKLHLILQILQDAGFRYHIKDANPIKHPFIKTERSDYLDLQLNISAFREKINN